MIDVLEALRQGLAPHYTVEREIGAGGMATVYLAMERHPPRRVAIKVMDPDVSTPAFRERFIREVELTSKLNHPHIVPILTATECLFVPSGPDGLCYYVMPYVEGESLRQRLVREKRLSPADALRVALEVADALSHAHAQGIIHRDIKPENILLSGDHALVADFGIARAISAAGGRTLTGVGEQVGSPAYMSPEQFTGSRAVDARTDIYSLACVLYEMLVGEPPLLDVLARPATGRSSLDDVLRQANVGHHGAGMLKEAIARGLATLPQDRFSSVDDFAASLRAVQDQLKGRLWFLGRGWKVALAVGVAAALVAGGLVFWGKRSPALNPRRVVVAALEDRTSDATLAFLGPLAADWITQGLAQGGRGRLEVVPSSPALSHHLDVERIRALAARTGAGTVVVGSYYAPGDSVRFELQIVDAARGTVVRALEPVGAPRAAPLGALEALRGRVAAVFDTLFALRP